MNYGRYQNFGTQKPKGALLRRSGSVRRYHYLPPYEGLYGRFYIQKREGVYPSVCRRAFEQTDVTGYSPSTSYGFDQYAGDPVHADIVKITDDELIGSNAVRSLILVDLSATGATAKTAPAMKRDYAVIPDSEGGSMDAYTYTGNFRSKGEKVTGTATTDDDWQTITFA